MAQSAEVWLPETMGERIFMIRKKRHVSQRELARRIRTFGVSVDEPAISKLEKGERLPTLKQALAIARALGVSLGDLGASESQYPDARFFRDKETVVLLRRMPP